MGNNSAQYKSRRARAPQPREGSRPPSVGPPNLQGCNCGTIGGSSHIKYHPPPPTHPQGCTINTQVPRMGPQGAGLKNYVRATSARASLPLPFIIHKRSFTGFSGAAGNNTPEPQERERPGLRPCTHKTGIFFGLFLGGTYDARAKEPERHCLRQCIYKGEHALSSAQGVG